ncbi:MAG: pantoate--beta-alanine ligase [Deltaproteobacteria bacterium]|nr:pantoate--beta-alanine ligase [Deltaproteobacteria bacterium]
MKILRTRNELQHWRAGLEATRPTVGFVPTMGALHRGHAELLRRIRPRCDVSVLSIFVNPTQFGPSEDLAKYPRTFERDLELACAQGVDVLFAPAPEEMYSSAHSTFVEETQVSRPLCGQFRPGHFRGVTTVVLKLFNLVRPKLALFGMKDAQQFFVLHQMNRDLDLRVSVEAIPTVREPDGLALSSRNAYLSADHRELAPRFYKTLAETSTRLRAGAPLSATLEAGRQALEACGFTVQYLDCVELPTFNSPNVVLPGCPYLLAAAVYLGATRLIDNVIVNPAALTAIGYSAPSFEPAESS